MIRFTVAMALRNMCSLLPDIYKEGFQGQWLEMLFQEMGNDEFPEILQFVEEHRPEVFEEFYSRTHDTPYMQGLVEQGYLHSKT